MDQGIMASKVAFYCIGFCLLIQSVNGLEDKSYCTDREDGLYPDPDDCARWYVCLDRQTNHHMCDYGLMYSHASGTCEHGAVCNIVCPNLYLSHGQLEITGYKPFDTAKHTCDKDFALIDGEEIRTCGTNGVWTGNTRRCWPGPTPKITDTFSLYPGYKFTKAILHDLTNVASGEHCAAMCKNLPKCKSANYQRQTKSCNLMDAMPSFLPDHLDAHEDFEYIELK